MKARPESLCVVLTALLLVVLTACTENKPTEQAKNPVVEEAVSTAVDAYVYGYSLITTEVTRVQMSNFPKAEGLHAPMGQFANALRYPPADYRGVSSPNANAAARPQNT